MNDPSITRAGAIVACLLAVLAVGALAVAACGGETASSTSPPPASPSTPATDSPIVVPIPALSHAVPPSTEPLVPRVRLAASAQAGTFGWKFRPVVDIMVTKLGCYEGTDGLARPHRVGIFDAGTKRLLASVTVRPKSRLDSLFRWESLEKPLLLKAGRPYLVGTEDKDTWETLYEPGEDEQGELSVKWASEIAFDWANNMYVSHPSEAAFTAPTARMAVWTNPPVFSPNLKFKPASAVAETTSPTLTKLMTYSYTTPRGPVLATRRSPSFTTHGGRLVARLVIDRVGNNSMQGWEADGPGTEWDGPVTGFWLVAQGERFDKETAPTAGSLGRTVGRYEGEFLTTDGKPPAAGVYRLHIITSRIDGSLTVLEEN